MTFRALVYLIASLGVVAAVEKPNTNELYQSNYAGKSGMWCVGLNAVGFDLDAAAGRNGVWTVPDRAAIAHFHRQGSNCFRLPITWERLQSRLGTVELSLVTGYTEIVNYITDELGAYVIIDPHNNDQGLKYNGIDASRSDFVKLWVGISKQFRTNPRVIFGLYNEPRYGKEAGITNYFDPDSLDASGQMIEHWRQWMQEAINAVRGEDATNLILVPGLHWTTCRDWSGALWWGENLDVYPKAGNTRLAALNDTAQNIAYDVHQYMDGSFTGTSNGCEGHENSNWGGPGVDWGLTQTIKWAQTYNKRLMMTEIGSWPANDGTEVACKAKMIDYLKKMRDSGVFIGYQVWQFGCPQCDGDLWSKRPLNVDWYGFDIFGSPSGSTSIGPSTTAGPATTTATSVHRICSQPGDDCRSSKCCADPSMKCYEKNQWYAACKQSCAPGIDLNDPLQFQTPWTCALMSGTSTIQSSTVPPSTPLTSTTSLTTSSPGIGFGSHIEGVSIDPMGRLYATHFRDTSDASFSGNEAGRNVIGQVDLSTGSASAYFTGEANAVFNGMRWDATGSSLYLADVGQGKVLRVDTKTMSSVDYCGDLAMRAAGVPNDLALSKAGLLYLSGQDWDSSTGALWLCKPSGTNRATAILLEAGMGRTNGIALSPDDRTLYVTEANGSPVSSASFADGQRIWKYSVLADGSIGNKVEFYNFALDPIVAEATVDSDGMRTDVAGNLYVTRNGGSKITVLSPSGRLLRELHLPSITSVTNLAFGGADGTTIYAVGRCGSASWGSGDGCIDVVHSDYAGREWSWFRGVASTSTMPVSSTSTTAISTPPTTLASTSTTHVSTTSTIAPTTPATTTLASSSTTHMSTTSTSTIAPTTPATTTPASTCAGQKEDCRSSACCTDPSLTCYEKNEWWGECRASCMPGIDPTDAPEFQTPWTCNAVTTVRTTPRPTCSPAKQDCRASRCCRDPGFTCYEKNQWWGECRPSCTPGIDPTDLPQFQTPWSCSVMTSVSTTAAPSCSGTKQDCRVSKCCDNPSFTCYEKNAWWAECRASCTPGVDPTDLPVFQTPWSCNVVTTADTRPPVCSGAEQDCRSSKCCIDRSHTCYEKNAWWGECRTSCTPGIDPTDLPEYQTPWSCTVMSGVRLLLL